MQESSLVKWVDELQAQIDAVKREVASIPEPVVNGIAITNGEVEMTATSSTGIVSGLISGSFDDEAYDFFLSLQYYISAYDGDDQTVVFGTVANVKTDGTVRSALFNATKVFYPLAGDTTIDVGIGRFNHSIVNTGITIEVEETPEVIDGTYDMEYVLIAVPKPATRTRKKEK